MEKNRQYEDILYICYVDGEMWIYKIGCDFSKQVLKLLYIHTYI